MDFEDSVNRGVRDFQAGNIEQAESALQSVLQVQPHHPQALHGQALVLHNRGDARGARLALLQAIEVSPYVAGYHNNLGYLLQEDGQELEAQAAFFNAVKLDPLQEDVYQNLGWVVEFPSESGQSLSLPRFLSAVTALEQRESHENAVAALQILSTLNPVPSVDVLGLLIARGVVDWERCVAVLALALPRILSEESLLQRVQKCFSQEKQYTGALAVGKRLCCLCPTNAHYQFNTALFAKHAGAAREVVIRYLRAALKLDPDLFDAQLLLAQMHKKEVAAWHFPMMNDQPRNEAFDNALQSVVKAGDLVLDIGAGSGLLSMMAARAGAEKVIACEQVEDLANIAQEIVSANGYGNTVSVHHLSSQNLRVGHGQPLGRRADVLVAEIFDAGLLGEKAATTFEHARAHLLKPDGVIIPGKATVHAALFESNTILKQLRVQNENSCGFDLSLFNRLGIVHYAQMDVNRFDWELLTDPVEVAHYDFHQDIVGSNNSEIFPITQTGTVHGVIFWFDLELAPGVNFSTNPKIEGTHWQQAVQILNDKREVVKGEETKLKVLSHQLNYRGIRFVWDTDP